MCTRYTLTSKHKADFLGVAADGKVTTSHIVEVDRVRDGQIVESWGEFNAVEVLGQLGALPDGFGQPHS